MKKVAAEPYRDIDFSKAKRGPVIAIEPGKTKISIRVDNAVIEYFRGLVERTGAGNYQTLMNDALLAGDKATAMQYLNTQAQEKYGRVFDALMPNMPQIIASYSPLQRGSISSSVGEYAINRTIQGANRIFLIYFLHDSNGLWRIDSM